MAEPDTTITTPDVTTDTTNVDDSASGKQTGSESSLSTWAGDYVTDMLGKGWGLSDADYEAYTGPLTAGESDLQTKAFQGVAGLTLPTDQMGGFTPGTFDATAAQQYMNPYLQAALNPQIEEAKRQAQIQQLQNAAGLTKAGAYGGTRQAVMDAESQRNLLSNLANITGQGYSQAYDRAAQQFNTEQQTAQAAQSLTNQFGLAGLQAMAELGAAQRGIATEGVEADYAQFEEERDFPYKQVQYMQSLLQGLPLAAQNYSYEQPNALSELMGIASGSGDIFDFLTDLYGKFTDDAPDTGTAISESSGTADDVNNEGGLE
jgi:hypothetical protein